MRDASWIIRPARGDEADAVADLHAVSWRSAYRGILPDATLGPELVPRRRAYWQKAFAREDWTAILVAEENSALVGFIAAWSDPEGIYDAIVESLHVHPARKRGGIGRALLGAAAAAAAAAGRRTLYLWVYDANAPARAFYEALGGAAADARIHEVAGHPVPEQRMMWPDAAAFAAQCANAAR